MARISRTGTTDSTGVASTTVSGSGGGRLKFISRNGGLWSNSKEVLDCYYYETIPNGTLKNGVLRHQNIGKSAISLSNEWSTVGTHSIKIVSSDWGWGAYHIDNPLIAKKGTVKLDCKNIGNVGYYVYVFIDGVQYSVNSNKTSDFEGTIQLDYDFTDKEGDITQIDVRGVSRISTQAIIYLDNIRIYPTFSAPKHYTPISLSSSASIIQTGETATLTAELTNVLGEKLAQKSVNFIEKSKQIFAIDGTSDTDNWRINEMNGGVTATATYSNEGTHFVATGTGASYISLYNGSTRPFDGTNDLIYEFDYKSANTSALYIINNGGSGVLIHNVISSTNWRHEKWVYDATNKVLTAYIDGVAQTPVDLSAQNLTTIGFQIVDWQTDVDFWIKNFKVFQDTTIDTETSNSQGVATTTITSNQTGERQFIAKADNIESETITITDNGYIYSHEEEITSNTSTDNYKVITTLSELPSQFELTFDYKTNGEARCGLFSSNNFTGNPNYSVFVGSPNGSSSKYYGVRTTTTNTSDVSGSPTDYHFYLIRRDGDTFYFQIDGGTVYSKSANWFDDYTYVLGLMGWGTDKTSSVKNIILRSI